MFFVGPSSSRNHSEELIFNVYFNSTVHQISIHSSKSVKDLKTEIQTRTDVPVCRQLIKGWSKYTITPSDSTTLNNLTSSKENNVFLTDLSNEGFDDEVMIVETTTPTTAPTVYQLRIHYANEAKDYNLNFPPTKTLLDIKNDINALTRIPVRHQRWIGWPDNSSNSTKLCDTGIGPIHNLTLSRFQDTENNFSCDM